MHSSYFDESKAKIFATILKGLSISPDCRDTLLSISVTGNVFLYSIKPDFNSYSPEQTKSSQKQKPKLEHPQEQRLTRQANDYIAITSKTNIVCIGTVKLIDDLTQVKIRAFEKEQIICICGFMYKKLPSAGIFQVKPNEFKLLYAENLYGVYDVTVIPTLNYSYAILPRMVSGGIAVLTPGPKLEGEYMPNIISSLQLAGVTLFKSTHFIAGTRTPNHFATWNDDDYPSITFWNLSPPYWAVASYTFSTKIYIRDVGFSPDGNYLGLILMDEKETAVCIWEISKIPIEQHNFKLDDSYRVTDAQWRQTEDDESVFCVWTTRGLIEATVSGLIGFLPEAVRGQLFAVAPGGAHFFFDRGVTLMIASRAVLDTDREAAAKIGERLEAFPLFKAVMQGQILAGRGVHMPRCMACRRPLMYPLVCKDKNISACYCSAACQSAHWPRYAAIHQPFFFESDEDLL